MTFTFDARISEYLDWLYKRRTDEVGRQCISVADDHYCTYVLSGNPQIRFETWELIHGTCLYLQQKGIGNDGLN